MDVDIICKFLKINKGGVGGVRKAGTRDQGLGKDRGFGGWSWIDCAPGWRNYLQLHGNEMRLPCCKRAN